MSRIAPIEPEAATSESADAYDAWFHAKVTRAMASTAPRLSPDAVKARAQAVIGTHKPG